MELGTQQVSSQCHAVEDLGNKPKGGARSTGNGVPGLGEQGPPWSEQGLKWPSRGTSCSLTLPALKEPKA